MAARVKGLILTHGSDIKNFIPEKLASDPVTPVEGQIWFNTTEKMFKTTDATGNVITLGTGAAGASVGDVMYDGMKADLDSFLARQSIATVTYDASNRPTLITYGNGYKVESTYVASGNGTGEVATMTYKKDTTSIYSIAYTYDASNRISATTVTEIA